MRAYLCLLSCLLYPQFLFAQEVSALNSLWKSSLFLGGLLVILLVIILLTKRNERLHGPKLLKLKETLHLTAHNKVVLVEYEGEYKLLGVSDGQICVLDSRTATAKSSGDVVKPDLDPDRRLLTTTLPAVNDEL